ncbi:type II secretory pathway, component PulJ [Serpentinimonas raichei]|uniref:Type II secretory pathway, component PulJ n=1 Tax=Serpentinimonas raichei TaxID=1458425 RepID=A0A060NFL1_9BURK|nr:prepilin-type N-terminal cleavage/methylation domain-containing protein [Serpentinimonas raichei]BAO80246.1 type II secretory pathway, component PulJ [Serpentinimonas raichei]
MQPLRALAPKPWPRPRTRGLTLIELLVALTIMSALALFSWRGLDGMSRTESHTRSHTQGWLQWQTALAQWSTDLNHLHENAVVPALSFDGQLLRLVRTDPHPPPDQEPGLVVVAWALSPASAEAPAHWSRWVSPPVTQQHDLLRAWQAAQLWQREPNADLPQQALALLPLRSWQVLLNQGGQWQPATTPAQTAPNQAAPTDPAALRAPEGVRLLLTPLEGQAVPGGPITHDWIHPRVGGGKSG